ncbi:DUF2848 family protein [Streptomyces boluensis]|uniref:DUF2848 domain-containing protein n=1 Tax=Streptomyces boluensis TaxID=1775135 RepID=A0A964XK30_9ACTN|nr:DUF2848 family protein [Streptomyces boluensis]NBE50138.1 DUF2848 domain-containing protein [Streptomyces boluensis]
MTQASPSPATVNVAGTGEVLELSPRRLIVAGYTARDEASVAHHIAELAAIGVPPPASVPAFYDLDPRLVTTDAVVEVAGPATSGEVEPVLIRHSGRHFLAVGSDHTDRDLERADIAASKAACPKPVGGTVVEIGPDLPGLDLPALLWDRIAAESTVDDQPYQEGSVATLRHPAELLERMTAVLGDVTGDLVLFCGTFPLLTGAFAHGSHWRVCLNLPNGTALTHSYATKLRSM